MYGLVLAATLVLGTPACSDDVEPMPRPDPTLYLCDCLCNVDGCNPPMVPCGFGLKCYVSTVEDAELPGNECPYAGVPSCHQQCQYAGGFASGSDACFPAE